LSIYLLPNIRKQNVRSSLTCDYGRRFWPLFDIFKNGIAFWRVTLSGDDEIISSNRYNRSASLRDPGVRVKEPRRMTLAITLRGPHRDPIALTSDGSITAHSRASEIQGFLKNNSIRYSLLASLKQLRKLRLQLRA
jgi:hypothetical protein